MSLTRVLRVFSPFPEVARPERRFVSATQQIRKYSNIYLSNPYLLKSSRSRGFSAAAGGARGGRTPRTARTARPAPLHILTDIGLGIRTLYYGKRSSNKPRHLICFKQWTSDMVQEIISSAINLKRCYPETRGLRLPTLAGAKIMILQEKNQPVLHMAVSKAATLLGAHDVCIIDKVVWEHDYMGKIFSKMADLIFVSTITHHCIQRFADQSTVPVMCMQSRTHSSIHALATIMTIVEEFGGMQGISVGYLGPPHPVLNSYLLLCPMLDANIKFKCCCDETPVSPLLYKAGEKLSEDHHTQMVSCKDRKEIFEDANVIIAGPTTTKKDKLKYFRIKLAELPKVKKWIFIHCCPRGKEVDDDLFDHNLARTYTTFENMHYISAALMANAAIGHKFEPCMPGAA